MSTPAWISSLPTGVVRTDLLSDAAGGVFTYAEALQVLTDVESAGAVTASEFSALQTVAANLDNGLAASAYVVSIFTQLVDGSPANATWTGGAVGTTTPLGNLKAGTTSAQLGELIGQWFLGTNLPDPTAPAAMPAPYSYTTINAPLYGSTGAAALDDICQGGDGDCELMSGVVELAENDPQQLASMIVANPNGTWGVRFYVGGNEVWETVNDVLPTYTGTTESIYAHDFNNENTSLWVQLVEKAYAQLSATGLIGHPAVDSYDNINADPPTDVLPNLTDSTQVNYFEYNASNFYSDKVWYIDAVASGDDVILETGGDAADTYDASGNIELVGDHAFAVVGYDSATGDFIVRNPWGDGVGDNWDTQFEVSLTDVTGVQGDFVIDNAGVDHSEIRLGSESGQVVAGAATPISKFFAISDTAGAAATRYNLQLVGGDSIQLGGATNLATAAQTALGQIVVSASDLSKLTITLAANAGQQDLLVSAYDGKAWSATVDVPLTVSPTSEAINPVIGSLVAAGGQAAVSSLFTLTGPAAAYDEFLVPTGGGAIDLNGAQNDWSGSEQQGYTGYVVAADQLSLLTYAAPLSGGAITLEATIYSGSAWSNWQDIQVDVGVSVATALLDYTNGQLGAAATVADSAANIFASLNALQTAFTAGELNLIRLTDTTPQKETLSGAEYDADLGVLSILQGDVAITVTGGIKQVVSSGVTSTGAVVLNGNELVVDKGGAAIATQISSGGVIETLAGATASTATLLGEAIVYGSASADTVSSGGLERVAAGGIDASALVYGGGELIVSSGGKATAATLRGGREYVYGSASGATVSSGGEVLVEAGGAASATKVMSGGLEYVYAGGVASAATVYSGGTLEGPGTVAGVSLVAGLVSGLTLGDAGRIEVSAGGTARGVKVTGASVVQVESGARVSATVVSAGVIDVYSGGLTSGDVLFSGGEQLVSSGGVDEGAVVSSGGVETIYAGGVAVGAKVLAGGVLTLDGEVKIEGAGTLDGRLLGSGTLAQMTSGDLVLSGADTAFTGRTLIEGGTVEVESAGALGIGYVQFAEPTTGSAVLQIDAADAPAAGGTFANTIYNFSGANEDIDLRSIAFVAGASATISGGILMLTDGGKTYKFKLAGTTAGAYPVLSDGHGGTLIDPVVARFAQTAAAFTPSHAGAAFLVSSGGSFGQTPFLHATASATAAHF